MAHDLIIRNGRLFLGDDFVEADIAVDEGKITSISTSLSTSGKSIDASGKLVIPGRIDPHVHIGEPGRIFGNEDFRTGTMAAAAGGVTTIFEMPTSIPPTTTVRTLETRLKLAEEKALVDYAFIGGASLLNAEEIPKLAARGVIAFKTFMIKLAKGVQGLSAIDNFELLKTLTMVKKTGLPHIIHAEDQNVLEGLESEIRAQGRSDVSAYCDSRPPFQERLGVIRAAYLAKQVGAKIILAHVSCAEALEAVRESKKQGANVFAEGRPEFFCFTDKDLAKAGAYLKTVPPMRKEYDVRAMWEALNEGLIDIIGSDHAPGTREEKESGQKDILSAPSGTPSLELTMPLLLDGCLAKGETSIVKLISAMTEKPAKVFNIYPRKGALRVGSDADITVIDPRLRKRIRREDLYSDGKDAAIAYEGLELTGWPVCTIVGGEIVMEDGNVYYRAHKPSLVSPSSSQTTPPAQSRVETLE